MSKIKISLKRGNSLFNKAILLFVSISFIAFAMTGIILSRFMSSYFENQSIAEMRLMFNMTESTVTSMLATVRDGDASGTLNADVLQSFITIYSQSTNMKIYIADINSDYKGFIVASSPSISRDYEINRNLETGVNIISPNEIGYYLSETQYTSVINSNGEELRDRNDFYGLYEGTDKKWLTLAKELIVTNAEGEQVYSGLIMIVSQQFSHTQTPRRTLINYFLLGMCISLLLSIMVTTFFTKRITEPLESLKSAATKVSKGDFCGKIEYDAEDDMGELIKSFNAMTRSLEIQDNTRNDFIANVSHELRTPITTIGGFINGMLDGTIPEEKRDYYLKIVRDEVDRINKLVNEQLQIARLKQGITGINQKSFDINEMIRREIIKNEKNIEDKHLEIEVEFEEDKQNVFAEEESINRVIINLLNNAIKFTPEGGIITLGTSKKKGAVEIFVKDTGVGIPDGDIERIFERYFKSDRSRGIDKTGTGLGLSICKGIINAHNHDIKAINNPEGIGTKFVFWLDAI